MKTTLATCIAALILYEIPAFGQGSFVNLDFESARLPVLPVGQGSVASSTNAFPGWTCYLGTAQQESVLYNAFTAGSAAISILGPNFEVGPAIEGSFDAVLMAGQSLGGTVSASMSQTGIVPIFSQSIQFKAVVSPLEAHLITLSMDGVPISLQPIATAPTYTIFGGNIALFAGQAATLTISALPPFGVGSFNFVFDSISFSSVAVPEPSTLVLFVLGFSVLWHRLWRRSP